MARDLVSKLLAVGLSAGVFLIWWPQHHAAAGLTSLIVRGALWTLCFELLLLAFAPLERAARRALAARMHRVRLQDRLAAIPARARLGGACVLACVGAALPVTLVAGAHVTRPARAAAPKRVIVVKRPVVRRVVVRQVVTVPAAVAHPGPLVVTRAHRVATETTKPATKHAKKPAVTTPAKTKTTTTTPQPATPATTTPDAAPPDGEPAPPPAG